MTLLNILSAGLLPILLSAIYLVAEILLIKQAIKSHNSEWTQQGGDGRWIHVADKTPYVRLWSFWGAVILTGFYIWAMLSIASDYKGV